MKSPRGTGHTPRMVRGAGPVLRVFLLRRTGAVAFALLACALASAAGAQPAAGASGGWREIPGPARYYHTATLLPTGKVLVAGGCEPPSPGAPACPTAANTVQLFDPVSSTWSPTGAMAVPRAGHTAVALPGGDVLVLGGCAGLTPAGICVPGAANSAERYDARTATWALVHGFENSFVAIFRGHTATLLPGGPASACGERCGKVLVAGATASLIWDPATSTATPTEPLLDPHGSLFLPLVDHTATLLRNGTVLVVAAELTSLYQPSSNSWVRGVAPGGRGYFSTNLLPRGQVLMTGGVEADGTPSAFPDLYEPDPGDVPAGPEGRGKWLPVRAPATARFAHAATGLKSGAVLIAGGRDAEGTALASAEAYRAGSGTWRPAGTMARPRGGPLVAKASPLVKWASHTATLLDDGRVLVVGGDADPAADLYSPPGSSSPSASAGPAAGNRTGLNRVWLLGAGLAAVAGLGAAARRRRGHR